MDVRIMDHGSIVQFIPESDTAREWINDNVQSEDWQWFGRALCVEPRYASDLIAGMIDAGLDVG